MNDYLGILLDDWPIVPSAGGTGGFDDWRLLDMWTGAPGLNESSNNDWTLLDMWTGAPMWSDPGTWDLASLLRSGAGAWYGDVDAGGTGWRPSIDGNKPTTGGGGSFLSDIGKMVSSVLRYLGGGSESGGSVASWLSNILKIAGLAGMLGSKNKGSSQIVSRTESPYTQAVWDALTPYVTAAYLEMLNKPVSPVTSDVLNRALLNLQQYEGLPLEAYQALKQTYQQQQELPQAAIDLAVENALKKFSPWGLQSGAAVDAATRAVIEKQLDYARNAQEAAEKYAKYTTLLPGSAASLYENMAGLSQIPDEQRRKTLSGLAQFLSASTQLPYDQVTKEKKSGLGDIYTALAALK